MNVRTYLTASTGPYYTNNTALAAHLVLSGHRLLGIMPHRHSANRVLFQFAQEARQVADAWYQTRDRLQKEAAFTLHEEEQRR
jgi:hypothetical protein